MAGQYQIPWAPPDISTGAGLLMQVMKSNRDAEIADRNAKIQEDYARRNLERESHRAYYERMQFERGEEDRRERAFASARELFKQGDTQSALGLLKRHGIQATPEMGPTTTTPAQMLTPADVLAAAPKQGPVSFYPAEAPHTPLSVMQRSFGGTHTGTTVPEEPPQFPQVAPPDVEVGAPPPSAVSDLEPMTIEDAVTSPGKPTGAYSFRGPGGQDMGRFDPSEERKFREAKASRVSEALGPLGQRYQLIQDLVARNDLDPKSAGALLSSLTHEDAAAAKVQDREDKQAEARLMGLSREDRLTEAQKNRDAAMARVKEGGQYRVAAATPTLKIDTANRQDVGALRTAFSEWKKTVNLNVDSKSHKRLATAMANLDSGNAMQEREAAESLVSIFKGGGQVTKASQDLLLKHLAGIVGDAQTWLQHKLSGNYGKMELDVLKQATRNALHEEQEKIDLYHQSFVDSFGPGSGWEQLGGNINALGKGAFRQFGYDMPDVYEGAESVVLGSGKRPSTPKAGKKPAGSAVPPGAITGTMNGKRGYVLNGKFTPLE